MSFEPVIRGARGDLRFLLGTHQPGWLGAIGVGLFVSDRRLRHRNCANCRRYALTWRTRLLHRLSNRVVQPSLWDDAAPGSAEHRWLLIDHRGEVAA